MCHNPKPQPKESQPLVEHTTEITPFPSKILDTTLPYQVLLPEAFSSEQDHVNLLVLLDGDDYAGMAHNVTDLYVYGDKNKTHGDSLLTEYAQKPMDLLHPSTQDTLQQYKHL